MEQIIGALIRTLCGRNRADRPESGGAFIGSRVLAAVDGYPLTSPDDVIDLLFDVS